MSSRSVLLLGNCFKGHSGFQVRSSELEAIDFPVTFLPACKSAERRGCKGGAARAGEPKLPQGHTTEPRHSVSGLQISCHSAVVKVSPPTHTHIYTPKCTETSNYDFTLAQVLYRLVKNEL